MSSWLSLCSQPLLRCHTYPVHPRKAFYKCSSPLVGGKCSWLFLCTHRKYFMNSPLVGTCLLGYRCVLSPCCVVTRTLCTRGKHFIGTVAPWVACTCLAREMLDPQSASQVRYEAGLPSTCKKHWFYLGPRHMFQKCVQNPS